MFCCVRQVKIPFIQPYLPLKCMSLKTQSYPRVQGNEELPPVQYENAGHLPTHETLREDILWNISLPCNVIPAVKVTDFNEDSRQLLPVCISSYPQRAKNQRRLSTQLRIVNEKINNFSNTHFTNILNHNGYSQNTVLFTNQCERLSSEMNTILNANHSVLQCSDTSKPAKGNASSNGRPSEAQLVKIQDRLIENLPKFFLMSHDYSLYNANLVFHNNISGVTTRGIAAYVKQISMVRVLALLKYTDVKMHVLKVTNHLEDGTVRVRWRISGVPGLKALFMFWKFRLSSLKDMKEAEWTDGFSVFSVGSDGLIYKHVCDKIMPDDNVQKINTGALGVKFAAGLGFLSNGGYLPV